MRLVLVGPPGAGKGTQAEVVAARLSVPHISTGDLFRANVSGGTELGREAQRYLDAGQLVPDSVTNAMVEDRFSGQDVSVGFLLDGYPRNAAQVQVLDQMLSDRGWSLDRVVELTVDRNEVTRRLVERARLQGRSDDSADVVGARFDVYDRDTAPILDLYRAAALLSQVDGTGDVGAVTARIIAAIGR
ncbi:MAG: adenylate kinase [Actinomycetes bacterium]